MTLEVVNEALFHPCLSYQNQGTNFLFWQGRVLKYTHLYVLFEEGNATHSSTLAWKIPWTEEPGRLQSMGSLRVGHDWATSFSLFTFMHWRRKWQPTPVFLPGESQGQEPGGLPSMGLHRVGHDWCGLAAAATAYVLLMCILLSDFHDKHINRPIPLVKSFESLITLIQVET